MLKMIGNRQNGASSGLDHPFPSGLYPPCSLLLFFFWGTPKVLVPNSTILQVSLSPNSAMLGCWARKAGQRLRVEGLWIKTPEATVTQDRGQFGQVPPHHRARSPPQGVI